MIDTILSVIEQVEFDGDFVVKFPDGRTYRRGVSEPLFTVHIKTERALREILRNPSMGLGESYMAEEVDIDGDMQQFCRFGFILKDSHFDTSWLEKIRFAIGYFLRRNTLEGSRKNIAAHYDLGNEFYSLWLDREAMQYTCAYFENETDTIEQAQIQKIDLVCRKLRLQPGESVVEAGCGWGGFALYAAQKYGVKMRSFNISKEQIAFAQEKAARLGVTNVEYVLDDYRNIGSDRRQYDKFVSIGMLEHVGVENYGTLYDIIHRAVKPRGLAMVHSISRNAPQKTDAWLEKYIFPGSLMPSLSEMCGPVEQSDRPLFVQDVENLRYHYALTLDHWVGRLEDHADLIRSKYGEAFYRMFRFYLHASAAGFRWGGILLYQMLLSNGYDNVAPLTRRHFFAEKKVTGLNGKVGVNGRARSNGKTSANGRAASNGKRTAKKKKAKATAKRR